MPATPANIARALRKARVVTLEDTAVRAAFPDARDQVDDPRPGYFELAADAEAALSMAADLLGKHRRRFIVGLSGEIWLNPADGVPTWRLVDAEYEVDAPGLVTRLEIDMEQETTTVELLV